MTDANGGRLNLTLEQVRERVLDLMMGGNACHYHIGQLYNYVVTENLAENGGYESAQQYFSLHFKSLSQASLSVYGTVARMFSEEACATYGMHHLRLLLTYKATKLRKKVPKLEPMTQEDPGPMPIEVPRQDGTVQTRPFAECSVEELRTAVRHLKAQAEAPKPVEETPGAPVPGTPLSEVDAARLQTLRESLAQRFSEGTVRLEAHVHQGKTFLDLRNVPMEQFEHFLAAMMEGLVPVRLVRPTG